MLRAVAMSLALLACAVGPAHASCERAAADLMNVVEIGGYRDGLSVSPDGASAAFVTRRVNWAADDVDHAVTVVALHGDFAARVVAQAGGTILDANGGRPNGAALDRIPLWSPDSQWLAYLVRRNERVELWRVRPSGGEPALVYTSQDADVMAFAWVSSVSIIVRLGPSYAVRNRALAEALERGFRIDRRLWVGYGLRPSPSATSGPSFFVDIAHHNEARPATAREAARLGQQDGEDIVRPINPDDDAFQPALGIFSGGRRCTADACSGMLRDAWRIGQRIYFLRNEGFANTETSIYEWSPRTNEVRLVRRVEDVLRACTPVGARLVCLREASLSPRHVVDIDLSDGAQIVLHDPNPDWSEPSLTPIERIDVVDAHGNESFAYLVYPADYDTTRTYPAVIVQYRARGFLNAGVGGEAPIHAFAACGYFVFAVERPELVQLQQSLNLADYMRQTELTNSEQQSKLSALERMLDVTAARGLIDPSRVAITGLSDGAETVYWGLIHSDRFAAAVAFSPPQDPSIWSLMSEDFRHAQRASVGLTAYNADTPPQWRHWWEAISPSLNIDRLRAPLLMELGETEALQAMQLYSELRDRGRPVEAFIYPGAGHIKWRPNQILASRERAMAWIDFWLKNELRADPSDPDRAARWAGLRSELARDRAQP